MQTDDSNRLMVDRILSAVRSEAEDRDFIQCIATALAQIPFLNLWDHCFIFAYRMFDEKEIPDHAKIGLDHLLLAQIQGEYIGRIKESNKDKSQNAMTSEERNHQRNARFAQLISELNVPLQPLQQWLADQICVAITKGEITPEILQKSLNGKIDPKRTYISTAIIEKWLATNRILPVLDDYDRDFSDADKLFKLIDRSKEYLTDKIYFEAKFLEIQIYNPDLSNPNRKDHNSFWHAYAQKLKERPCSPIKEKRIHGNTEKNSKTKAEILSAALYVVNHYPDECMFKEDTKGLVATKIAKLIDEKSTLFWPELFEPPAARVTIENHIRKAIQEKQ